MYEFVVMVIVLPVVITSTFLGELALQDFLLRRELKFSAYPLVLGIYWIQEYFILKFSLETVGYIFFRYVIALSIFFMGKKRFGYLLVGLTPLIFVMFLFANGLIARAVMGNFVIETLILLGICFLMDQTDKKFLSFTLAFICLTLLGPLIATKLYGVKMFLDSTLFIWLGLALLIFLIFDNCYHKYIERKAKHLAQIEYSSTHDGLTDLLNYNAFSKQVKSKQGPPVVCALDLDHFKQINDTYGHLEGNRVLQYFARFLRDNCRQKFKGQCKVYRFGGEEFCVLIDTTSLKECWRFFNALEEKLRKTPFATEGGTDVYLSFSGGIAQADDELGLHNAVRRADMALYRAKKNGRAQVDLIIGNEK